MTFDYRDADGDTFIVANNKTDAGQPVVWMATSPDGVYIDLNRVEEVVAGIRDAARTAARQTTGQDDTCTCDAAGPAFVPAGHYRDCPQYTEPAPAVGQPAEAHDTQARPPRVQWRVEGHDADVWLPVSRSFDSSADAHARKHADTRYPDVPTRVVRETTTWTVEDETAPAPEQLVPVGWWCWRGDNHGHLAHTACRSDNVPLHVPAEWADDMRAVIQHLTDDHDPGEDCIWVTPEEQAAETLAAADTVEGER